MIDFHCHLDLYPNPHAVAAECASRNLYVLSVTNTPSAWTGSSKLGSASPRIRTALGLHPQIAYERKGELPLFEKLLPQTSYVGEIGLDGGQEFRQYWSDQVTVFTTILDACARAGGKVLSIHSRHAATPILDALKAQPDVGTAVLHWFSGKQGELKRAIEYGCWFSVNFSMISSIRGRTIVEGIPRNRIITESDGPFARVGRNPAVPWDVGRTVAVIAEIWGVPEIVVKEQILLNFRTLTTQGNLARD